MSRIVYLRRLRIEQFRSIDTLDWKLPRGVEGPGWHVILGENGTGKSSVLRAAALSLIGPEQATGLQVNWNQWVRFGKSHSRVRASLGVTRDEKQLDLRVVRKPFPGVVPSRRRDDSWARPRSLPFAASFGPFRRFTGGDVSFDALLESGVPFSGHLSLFNESVALGVGVSWLKTLAATRSALSTEAVFTKDKKRLADFSRLLERIQGFVNQPGFLPHGEQLEEVTHERVIFRDGRKARVEVEQMSDGFRSILSLVFELVRRAVLLAGPTRLFDRSATKVVVPGIVCIDEADAHLHPRWQREIGPWLCRLFPRIQFLVTTHSPFVCQAAEHGSVFHLPATGGARFIDGIELARLRVGNVLEAYGTEAFGMVETRSASGLELVSRLAELNSKQLAESLNGHERREQRRLRADLPTAALGESVR
jgi:hypothetical protein